jgi:hypothetical protein
MQESSILIFFWLLSNLASKDKNSNSISARGTVDFEDTQQALGHLLPRCP